MRGRRRDAGQRRSVLPEKVRKKNKDMMEEEEETAADDAEEEAGPVKGMRR